MNVPDECQFRLRLGTFIYNPGPCQLFNQDGDAVPIRKKSLRVLGKLAARNGRTIGRDELISDAWAGKFVSDDNLVQCIKDIRTVLGDRDRQLLRTAVGIGYSLHGIRERPIRPGARPKLLLSRFQISGDAPVLVDIADTIIEELIVALSPRAGLNVTTDEAQRETALYSINGRASQSGEYLRVFVQLVQGQSGDVAFAKTWTVAITEVATLPELITDKIASVLRVHMFNHAGEDHIGRPNDTLDTQELLAKAAYHMSRIQMKNRDVARDALSVAIDREPTNAMALAMRASTSVILILQAGYRNLPDAPDYCLELADRAVEIAPHIDFVIRTRGNLRLWLKGDHDGARADCERALEISPVFHLAHQTIAASEILSGEHAAGVRRAKRIMDLGTVSNPRNPHYLALMALGQILYGDDKAAIRTASEGHERAPSDPWCTYVYAAAAGKDDLAKSRDFQRMITDANLPFGHFRDLPFTDLKDVEMLEERLTLAGYPNP